MTLVDKTVRELLASFSSPAPTPGGGSASALASALGASLLVMVGSLSKTRSGSDDEKVALAAAVQALTGVSGRLTDAVDADAAAYDEVVAAYKLPKASPGERATRKAAIQQALRAATDVPLAVMRLSADALEHATTIAEDGYDGAASDVGVALALLGAGLRGAHLNVDINLASSKDQAYVKAARAEADGHARRGESAVRTAEESLVNP